MSATNPDLGERERDEIRQRDGWRCYGCGQRGATIQHRQAKGMGGIGPKHDKLGGPDGIVLCNDCNVRAEGDLQDEALTKGWKVPRNTKYPLSWIPVFDTATKKWWVLNEDFQRSHLSHDAAMKRMRLSLASAT